MKIGLVTTTINLPVALKLLRVFGADVSIFVAGDRKTPDGVSDFCSGLGARYISFAAQERLYPALSKLVGPDCVQRRNFATLEALKSGAEIIVVWDDDNIPMDKNYFQDFARVLLTSKNELVSPGNIRHTTDAAPFSGLKASSPTGWFDVGQLLQPKAPHRGFPHIKAAPPTFESITDAKIGVAAGICLGDPDISAVERIANAPIVHGVSEVLRSGVVTDPKKTWTVFNTQNTAFIRELAPAMFCPPGLGRYDDIFASLVTQRVMRERGLHVHFGKPLVWQQRNQHDLVKDLQAELWGMKHVVGFSEYLDSPVASEKIAGKPVLEQVRAIYDDLQGNVDFPQRASEAALAFLADLEGML